MACTPTPTATLFATQQITTSSLSTSNSLSVQTITNSDVVTTITTCAVSISGSISACPSLNTITSTIPGDTITTTHTVPVVLTIPVTEATTVPTLTQFTTVCASSQAPPSSSTPDSPVPSDLPPSSSLPAPSTLPNGQITIINSQTITSTPPASTIFTTPGPTPDLNQNTSTGTKSLPNLGPIIGGAVGGFFALVAIVVALLCYRRRKHWDDIFEKDIGHGIGDDDDRSFRVNRVEPMPYHYGLIGHTPSPSLSPPPTSPSVRHNLLQYPSQISRESRTSSANASVYSRESMIPLTASAQSEYNAVNRPPSGHGRRPSIQNEIPLLNRPLLQQGGSSSPNIPQDSGDRRHSVSSPTQPRSPNSFYVTNGGPEEAASTSRRPASAGGVGTSQKQRNPPRRSSSQQPIIVHTDGGRIGNAPTTPSNVSGSPEEPPAYTKT